MEKFDKDKVFFTSDLHFGHTNIIRFCGRPYTDVKEMNQALIDNWNKAVPEDGIVFVLGDIGFCSVQVLKNIFNKLNGTKYLILGNHDYKMQKQLQKACIFEEICNMKRIQVDGCNIVLCHYPMLCFDGSHRGNLQLFGHVHSGPGIVTDDTIKIKSLLPTQYDVGVYNNNYTPVSFPQLQAIINNRKKEYETNRQFS